jgi:hypothetical protein
MTESGLPNALIQLIQHCLPSFQAAELLVFMARKPSAAWTLDSLNTELPQDAFDRSSLANLLPFLSSRGLVQEQPPGTFAYHPASKELKEAVDLLATAFNERPVTLIRTIYALADHPIQSFADSFRFKTP